MRLLILTQKIDINDPVLGFFCRWIEKFSKHFEKIEVIALEVGQHNLPPNVSVHSLGKERIKSKISYLLLVIRYLLTLRYDAVFVHMNPEYLAVFGWYWKLTRKRTSLWYTHKSVTLWLRVAEKFVDKIFTASKESFRLPSKKVEIVGHGIDIELFQISDFRFQNDECKLLSVGRITPSKDLETIIRAVKKLQNDDIHVSLDIVGAPALGSDKAYANTLEELVRALGLQEVVKFLGAKAYSELPQIYQSHDLLIHTSKTGSIDKVVLESLACGTPVISSSEAFHDFPAHLRFRENDADDLVEKIRNFTQAKPDISSLVESIRTHNDLDKLIKTISVLLQGEAHR